MFSISALSVTLVLLVITLLFSHIDVEVAKLISCLVAANYSNIVPELVLF